VNKSGKMIDYEKIEKLNNEKIIRHAEKWYKPRLFSGQNPTFIFKGYDEIKVKLISPSFLENEKNFFYENLIENMAQIQLSTYMLNGEEVNDLTFEEKENIVKKALKERAGTVLLECVSLTFNLDGITRALSAEINRHRAMGFGEQSQRAVDTRHNAIRISPDVAKSEFINEYIELMNKVKKLYCKMIDSGKIPIEQARNIMPIGLITHEVETGNLRGWLAVWNARIQKEAMDEHQILTYLEVKELKEKIPKLYNLLKETGNIFDIEKIEWIK
jgi:flavin-dependent thymidylate synthase